MKAILIHNPFVWYKPATWLYWLIRVFTGSFWNHAVIHTSWETRPLTVEANYHGVIVKPREQTSERRIIAYLEFPDTFDEGAFDRMIYSLNKKYDFLVFFRYLLKRNRRNKRFYCFELLGYVYNMDTSKILTGKDFEKYIVNIQFYEKSNPNGKTNETG